MHWHAYSLTSSGETLCTSAVFPPSHFRTPVRGGTSDIGWLYSALGNGYLLRNGTMRFVFVPRWLFLTPRISGVFVNGPWSAENPPR